MKPYLIGENPLDIDRLHEYMIQRTSGQRSLAGTMVTAISGIEIAGMRVTGKIADFAGSFYIPLALHNVSSPVGTLAAVDVATAISNFLGLEYHALDVEWWEDPVKDLIIEDGYVKVPEESALALTSILTS